MSKLLGKIWNLTSNSCHLMLSYSQGETAQLYEEASIDLK